MTDAKARALIGKIFGIHGRSMPSGEVLDALMYEACKAHEDASETILEKFRELDKIGYMNLGKIIRDASQEWWGNNAQKFTTQAKCSGCHGEGSYWVVFPISTGKGYNDATLPCVCQERNGKSDKEKFSKYYRLFEIEQMQKKGQLAMIPKGKSAERVALHYGFLKNPQEMKEIFVDGFSRFNLEFLKK